MPVLEPLLEFLTRADWDDRKTLGYECSAILLEIIIDCVYPLIYMEGLASVFLHKHALKYIHNESQFVGTFTLYSGLKE